MRHVRRLLRRVGWTPQKLERRGTLNGVLCRLVVHGIPMPMTGVVAARAARYGSMRTKRSGRRFASPGARLVAYETNATKRPSADRAGT